MTKAGVTREEAANSTRQRNPRPRAPLPPVAAPRPRCLVPARDDLPAVAERNAEAPGRGDDLAFRGDVLHLRHRVLERYGHDRVAAEGGHGAELAAGDEVGGGFAETAGQDAVEGDGRAAALDVAEDGHADLQVDGRGDVGGDLVGDPAEAARG